MRIIFLNSLEKWSLGELMSTAQVWIGEEQGVWRIGWDELAEEEGDSTLWYEGESWAEMLHVYRYQLAGKLSGGYRPVIDGVFHESEGERAGMSQKLYCYCELNYNEELYEELTVWRRKQATATRKAPYLIASNRLLKLISAFVPQSEEELLQLPGVGEGKAAQYGGELLAITADKTQEHGFPLDWVKDKLDEEDFRSWLYKQKESRFKEEMTRYSQRSQLLKGIREGQRLEQIQETSGLVRREAVTLLEQLDKEGYDTDKLLNLELADVPEAEQTAVWNAYEELGDDFLKPVLRRVYGEESSLPGKGELERKYEQLRLIRIRYRRESKAGRIQSA